MAASARVTEAAGKICKHATACVTYLNDEELYEVLKIVETAIFVARTRHEVHMGKKRKKK